MIAARKGFAFFATLMVLMVVMSQSAGAASVDAGADKALLATLLQRMRQHDTVKAQFTQQKTLRILKRPLQSEGSLLFWRGHGMVWQVTAPIAATYVLNAQGMREVVTSSAAAPSTNSAASSATNSAMPQSANSAMPQSTNSAMSQSANSAMPQSTNSAMPQSTNSAMPNMLPLFDAIFAGDEATLAQHFDYRVAGTAQQWQLSLIPRDDMLLRVFQHLELTGRDYIDSITLFDTRGDQTRIELHQPQFGSERLSADDHALLP